MHAPLGSTVVPMEWHGFTLVDLFVAVFLIAGIAGGVRRGLSGELARALTAAAGIGAGIAYARPLAERLPALWNIETRVATVFAFLLIFLGVYIVINVLRLAVGKLVSFRFKGAWEWAGGGIAGLLRASAVAVLILLLLILAPNDNLHRLIAQESRSGRLVMGYARPLLDRVSTELPALQLPVPGDADELPLPDAAAIPADPANAAPEEPAPAEPTPVADDLAPYSLEGLELGPVDSQPQP